MADIKFRNLSSFIEILCLDVSEVSVHDSDIPRSAKQRHGRGRILTPSGCLIRVSV